MADIDFQPIDFQPEGEKPMASHESINPLPTGLLGGAGLAAATVGPSMVKPAVRLLGKGLEKSANAPKLLGGTVGASIGGMAAHAVGASPFAGTYFGGAVGSRMGKPLSSPIKAAGKYLQEIGQKNPMIPKASRATAVFAGRQGLGMIEKALPYLGAAGMAADLGSVLYDHGGDVVGALRSATPSSIAQHLMDASGIAGNASLPVAEFQPGYQRFDPGKGKDIELTPEIDPQTREALLALMLQR